MFTSFAIWIANELVCRHWIGGKILYRWGILYLELFYLRYYVLVSDFLSSIISFFYMIVSVLQLWFASALGNMYFFFNFSTDKTVKSGHLVSLVNNLAPLHEIWIFWFYTFYCSQCYILRRPGNLVMTSHIRIQIWW